MKYSVLYLALAACIFTGCHEDDPETEISRDNRIMFNTSITPAQVPGTRSSPEPLLKKSILRAEDGKILNLTVKEEPMDVSFDRALTRGAQINTADITEFGVSSAICMKASSYTAVGCGSLFYDQSVGSGVATDYSWPTNAYRVSFYAYYPYGNANLALSSLATDRGIPAYTYTVPEDAADHVDVMTANVLNMLGGQQTPVNLSFQHRLAAIRFRLTNTGDNPMIVKSVTIAGVKYTGTLRNAAWTLGSDTRSSVLACNDTEVESGETVDLTDGNYMFMLPQTLPSTAKVILETEKNTFEGTISGSWAAGQVYTFSINANDMVNYLRFTAIEDGTFTLTIPASVNTSYLTSVSYSLDDGDTWVTTENSSSAVTITTPTVTAGNAVLWKGDGKQYSSGTSFSTASKFSSTGRYNVSGSIMSLLYGNGVNKTVLPGSYTFIYLFNNNTKLVDASELLLPATTLRERCYDHMFSSCSSLTAAPELPATTLQSFCYYGMFVSCNALTTAPELPATTLTLGCYNYMFAYCSSLTTVPELPATTLQNQCYSMMFMRCTKLNYVKAAFVDIPYNNCLTDWLANVSKTGTFVKNAAATWTGYIPSGWTVETYTPE